MWETPWTSLYEIEIPVGVLSWENCPLKSAEKAASCQLQSNGKSFGALLPPELAG